MSNSANGFRSALHGFHRSDVVEFIQQQTETHEKALRQAREETARLSQELEALRRENEELLQQIEALKTEALEEALTAPPAPAQPAADPAPSLNELELAAYRRAELTERLARERAAASDQRLRATYAQISQKLGVSQQDLATVCDAFRSDYGQLMQLLAGMQTLLAESAENLQPPQEGCEG